MRLLNCLYVLEHGTRISSHHGALMVTKRDGSKSRVPLEAIEAMVLLGAAQVTSEAIEACVNRKVRVAALRRSGKVRFVIGGPTSGNVYLRVAQQQVAQDPPRRAAIARWVVAGKLQNYRKLLRRWSWDASLLARVHLTDLEDRIGLRIGRLEGQEDGDRIRGIEGDGTRLYFKGLAHHLDAHGSEFPFLGRQRRPPRDPVNAMLGFVYGLVLTEVVGACEAAGLDPQIGFLHGVRPGRPSLALDLLEEFRPALADRFVAGLFTRRMLRVHDFVFTAGGACYLTDEARRRVIEAYEAIKSESVVHRLLGREVIRATLPSLQAILMARHLRGDLPAYPPFVLAS
ncbi:MAG TPA: CRISPR-associated endonuclease Cas1 [Actinomycetota bacterium]